MQVKDNVKSSKQVVKNTIMLYIRQFFILFLNLYTVRQVLIVLGETDYGVYTVVAGIVTMFSILSGAMSGACQRFFSYDLGREDYEKLNYKIHYQLKCCSYNKNMNYYFL